MVESIDERKYKCDRIPKDVEAAFLKKKEKTSWFYRKVEEGALNKPIIDLWSDTRRQDRG
jgi:hypothetical protein